MGHVDGNIPENWRLPLWAKSLVASVYETHPVEVHLEQHAIVSGVGAG